MAEPALAVRGLEVRYGAVPAVRDLSLEVSPGEIVEIAVRFTNYSGRYMYHCHILEHEDRDMMRPFVTMAPELMPFMA